MNRFRDQFARAWAQPLLQFLMLGFAAWVLMGLLTAFRGSVDNAVVITQADVERLAERFRQTMMRPPGKAELDALVEQYLREELYLREGLSMGLDQGDPVIRKRIFSKVDFLLRAEIEALQPGDDELRAIMQANAGQYTETTRTSFQQVWLAEGSDAQAALGAIKAGAAELPVRSSLLPEALAEASPDAIDRVFGTGFAAQLDTLPPGEWAGPLRSGYGQHLVRVSQRTTLPAPGFESLSGELLNQWRAEQRKKLDARTLDALKEKYDVFIEAYR